MIKLLLAWTIVLSAAHAEYRVFTLDIINEETGKTRTVQSTLDHIQYRTYYPLKAGEYVSYVDSWMCWENTNGFRPACERAEENYTPLSPWACIELCLNMIS